MPVALSNDLRKRVVDFVEAGHSCHEAARQFATSVSFAVNLMTLYRETGGVEPRPRGGLPFGMPLGLLSGCLRTISGHSKTDANPKRLFRPFCIQAPTPRKTSAWTLSRSRLLPSPTLLPCGDISLSSGSSQKR